MTTLSSNPHKHDNDIPADTERPSMVIRKGSINRTNNRKIPSDVEQPSILIRQDSIQQMSKNKILWRVLFILLGALIIAAMAAVYFFLLEPDATTTEVPLKPPTTNRGGGPIVEETQENTTPSAIRSLPPKRLQGTPVPSVSLTLAPTASPTKSIKAAIEEFLFQDDVEVRAASRNLAVAKAIDWLADEATATNSFFVPLDLKLSQRFGILVFYYSVFQDKEYGVGAGPLPNIGMRTQDECFWRGMTCDSKGNLIEIKLNKRELNGVLPSDWGFFPYLKSIDVSKNQLTGSIPEELYDLTNLKKIYFYKNALSGTISSKIGKLTDLTHFHASNNLIGGNIPRQFSRLKQLQYFNVHRNQMTGSIPSISMRLRQLVFLDLGRNQFSGSLPAIFGSESIRLRHLHLDHNRFSGEFPSEFLNAGDGRLRTLTLNDNNLTGVFPGDHKYSGIIMELTIHNNNFKSMERSTCQLDVFSGGELVEFKSDCLVCRCGFALMCRYCQL